MSCIYFPTHAWNTSCREAAWGIRGGCVPVTSTNSVYTISLTQGCTNILMFSYCRLKSKFQQ